MVRINGSHLAQPAASAMVRMSVGGGGELKFASRRKGHAPNDENEQAGQTELHV